MKSKRHVLKNIVITILCLTCVASSVLTSLPKAKAATDLGTNVTLGSPVLNKDFVLEDWNKWEMEVWGIYLSNFCIPLVDTYETAFKTGSGIGSNGSGYRALCFGSGSDPANNKIIQQLCDDAILYQKTVTKNIYVTYNVRFIDATTGKLTTTCPNANDPASNPRLATFTDLYFQKGQSAGRTSANDIDDNFITHNNSMTTFEDNYVPVSHITDAYIPTFWIKNESGKYIEILDYMDSWDLQLSTALLNAVRISNSLDFSVDDYKKKFEELMQSNVTIVLDAFGNITTQDKLMVIPAALNPNLTVEKQINLLNSWIFNSYYATYTDAQIALDLGQSDAWWQLRTGGFPAFTETDKLKGICLLYYDMDNVMVYDRGYNIETGKPAINYGHSLMNFFDASVTDDKTRYNIKIEIAGLNDKYHRFFHGLNTFECHTLVTSLLSNEVASLDREIPKILDTIIMPDGSSSSLFSADNTVIVAPQLKLADFEDDDGKDGKDIRMFYNYIYDVYCGQFGAEKANALKNSLQHNCETFDQFTNFITYLHADFEKTYPEYKNPNWDSQWKDAWDNESVNEDGNRLCKVYAVTPTMRTLGNTMNLKDSDEFKTFCTVIYATYLDWYGIGKNDLIGKDQDKANFNPEIFDGKSDITGYDPASRLDVKTQAEKEKEILDLGYLMLSPEEGREYRKQMLFSGFSDFAYEAYNRTVYGGANSMYNGGASSSDKGFLAISTLDQNIFTKWFLDSYVDICTILIGVAFCAVIVIGVLKKRKLSWYILTLILAVNIILIIPSSGELVPYITGKYVQRLFNLNMTFWSMSEGVTNNNSEAEMINSQSENADFIQNAMSLLSVNHTDRSLMLKQDISQKLTMKTAGIYDEIQSLRSARWLLPIIMQQFTNNEGTSEYLYVKLSNVWDDMSNLYWYYDPLDATAVTKSTATSDQSGNAATSMLDYGAEDVFEKDTKSYNKLVDYYSDIYKQPYTSRYNNYNYRCYSYTELGDLQNQVHLYAYALDERLHPGLVIPSRKDIINNSTYVNADSWQKYIDYCNSNYTSQLSSCLNTSQVNGFEETADEYSRIVRATIRGDYSYLKHTENIAYYFFNVVKDSLSITVDTNTGEKTTQTVGSIVNRLQGTIYTAPDGTQIRSSFMHATITDNIEDDEVNVRNYAEVTYTPYVRDVLDLENLFNNVIPYLYQVQLATGGFDGTSGILGDKKIEDLQFYKDQYQSWMYRCNWATKLMESPEFSKPMTVKDANGNKFTVANPMLPELYPESRPMVFSEAQMHAYGLKESDLNIVELKCVEVNKDVCDRWTLLLNYVGMEGLTKEVIYRQMAIDATSVFNSEFSGSALVNSKYALYPNSIDLRYLSFDSIMKVLMMNVSGNTHFAYGDSMLTVINDNGIGTTILLLACACVCVTIVPLVRDFLMALIFFAGFLAIVRALMSDGKTKANIACGQLISNVLFCAYTIVYFFCFSILMSVTSSEDMLRVSKMTTETKDPWVVLVLVLAFSILYLVVLIKHIIFCLKNYRDMGYAFYSMMAESVTSRIQEGLSNISSKMYSMVSGESLDGGGGSTSTLESAKGSGKKKKKPQDVNVKSTNKEPMTVETSESTDEEDDTLNQQTYDTGALPEDTTDGSSAEIDAEIEKGKSI